MLIKFHPQCPPWSGRSALRHCWCPRRDRPPGTGAGSRCPACSPSSPRTRGSRSRESSRRGRRRPPLCPRCPCCPACTCSHTRLSSDTDSWSCIWMEEITCKNNNNKISDIRLTCPEELHNWRPNTCLCARTASTTSSSSPGSASAGGSTWSAAPPGSTPEARRRARTYCCCSF